MGQAASHHTGIGCHRNNLWNTSSLEYTVICLVTHIIIPFQVLLGSMERIGIFHGELPNTDHPGSWACLITEFTLQLINHKRIFCISLGILPHQMHSGFFVGHPQHHFGTTAVGKTKQFISYAFIPSRLLPQICWQGNGEQYFLSVNGIQFLTDDMFNLGCDTTQCGKLRKNTVSYKLHIATTNHKCMAVNHTVRWFLLKTGSY